MNVTDAAQQVGVCSFALMVALGIAAAVIYPMNTLDHTWKGRRFRAARPAVRAFVKAKLRSAPRTTITAAEVDAFDLGIEHGVAPEAVANRWNTRKKVGAVVGYTVWVALIAVVASLAVAGISSTAQDNQRHDRWVARLSADVTKTYGLPGKVNLADWKHLGPEVYAPADSDTVQLDMGNGNHDCPASAGWCFNGAVLLRDGTVQPASLVIVGGKPILVDVNGVELPRPATK